MKIFPLNLKEANAFVTSYHRHNKSCLGHRFSIGVMDEHEAIWGVAICGRPIARLLDQAGSLEVLRLCVREGAPKNACSFLYRACVRVWKAMGGVKVLTYTLQSESGSSLKGSGFKLVSSFDGGGWDRETRQREFQEVSMQAKHRWEINLKP